MTTRYCPRCAADVADVGGFCLLGHPLAVAAETGTFEQLRHDSESPDEQPESEMDREPEPAPVDESEPEPTAEPAPVAEPEPEAEPEPALATVPAPPPPGPPPPPRDVSREPRPKARPSRYAIPDELPRRGGATEDSPAPPSAYGTLTEEAPSNGGDPIAAFSPPAHMDWGPAERSSLIRRRHGRDHDDH